MKQIMECKVNYDPLCVSEIILKENTEQSVELDYLLPDYYPDIFKVLRCKLTPKILSKRTSTDKLIFDGVVYINVLYINEDSSEISAVMQQLPFSKTMELSEACDNPFVNISCKTDYVNCRVVNQRRLDIRGAVTCKVTVIGDDCQDIASEIICKGVHSYKKEVCANTDKLSTLKQFTLREELEIGNGKPGISKILCTQAVATVTDTKIISNKVVTKGEIILKTVYVTQEDLSTPETMEHIIPISQIVDLNGVEPDYLCYASYNIVGINPEPISDSDEENKALGISFDITVCCSAYKCEKISLIKDVYSTCMELETQTKVVNLECTKDIINQKLMEKFTVDIPEGSMSEIFNVCCNADDFTVKNCSDSFVFMGNITVGILGRNDIAAYLEKTVPIELCIATDYDTAGLTANPKIEVINCSYSFTSDNGLEIRAEIKVTATVTSSESVSVITEVEAKCEKDRSKLPDNALTIYYADKGENVWDIAKRYNTSMDAILIENDLFSDIIENRGMIFIPQID